VTAILIVDDHPIVREGLKRILANEPDMAVEGEANAMREAVAQLQARQWDVVVLEVALPDQSGLEILSYITHQPAAPPVLVFTVYAEEPYALRLLRMGAAGYLTKQAGPQELITALRRVANGQRYISPALAELLTAESDRHPAQSRHATLSNREFEVLCLIASGKTVSEIAAVLSVSVATVSTHRRRLLEKMRLMSNTDLIQYALWHRLVPWRPEAIMP
jgi:two-component system invasion response regulator UvrY